MTRAKVCGIKTFDALDAAIECGADYVGLVFFPKSPRHLTLSRAAELADHARGNSGVVALIVDADDSAIDQLVEHVSPDVLQLHGSETPQRVAAIKRHTGRTVWKAISVGAACDVARTSDYIGVADLILYDAQPPKGAALPGGNGHPFDWSALDGVKGKFEFMLSGGLNPENVAEAIRVTQPWGVDVSSGVESSPGVKDTELIRRFLRAVKSIKRY